MFASTQHTFFSEKFCQQTVAEHQCDRTVTVLWKSAFFPPNNSKKLLDEKKSINSLFFHESALDTEADDLSWKLKSNIQGSLCERDLECIKSSLSLVAHSDNHLNYLTVKILIMRCLYCPKLIR